MQSVKKSSGVTLTYLKLYFVRVLLIDWYYLIQLYIYLSEFVKQEVRK